MSGPDQPAARVWGPLAVAVVAVAVATAIFGAMGAPRESIPEFWALFFASTAVVGGVVWWARAGLWGLNWRRALCLVIVVAAVFRMAALVAPVSLSDDIWRYLWDGELVAAGENPYEASASERRQAGQGDFALYEKLNRPDAHTVYPPLAQGVFAAAVMLEQGVGGAAQRWLRILFVLFDLLGIGVLGWVLVRCGRSPMWAALYGWHPLAYWEVAAGGHTEALAIVWLAALLGFALSHRPLACGVAIGLAGLAKWTLLVVSPVVALYLLARRGWGAVAQVTGAALAVFGAGYLYFWSPRLWNNHRESLGLYTEHFSFNAPVYYVFRWALGYREGITEPVSHITGPVLTVVTVITVMAVALWQDGSRHRLLAGAALACAAYVVFTPVFHPWYALPLLVTGALVGWTTPAVVGAVIALSYGYYAPWSTVGVEVGLMALQTGIVGGWMIWEFGPRWVHWILRRRGARKAAVVDEVAEESASILDLGAGEGYVGAELAARGHRVELADIVDRNRSDLEMTVYDGRRLPFDENAFDVVVIAYVLHHAQAPDAVIADALRVGRRVVILETVYEKDWDRRLVTALDHGANMLRGMAPQALKLDTVQGWVSRLEAGGGEVLNWRWLGRGLHRHVLMVCESSEAPREGG